MIRRRFRLLSRPFAIAAPATASITPSPRCRSSSPSRTKSGSHPPASTLRPADHGGTITTGRQNTASSPADGTASPAVTVSPPRTRRPAARTTTVPAGVPPHRGTPMSGLHRQRQADKKAQGLLGWRGLDTQTPTRSPPQGQNALGPPAAPPKTQVTAMRAGRFNSVVLAQGAGRKMFSASGQEGSSGAPDGGGAPRTLCGHPRDGSPRLCTFPGFPRREILVAGIEGGRSMADSDSDYQFAAVKTSWRVLSARAERWPRPRA